MFSKTRTESYTNSLSEEMPNGYLETIQKGVSAVRSFSRIVAPVKEKKEEQIQRLKEEILRADSIVVGGGAGLSASAGFTYQGERFDQWFSDFSEKYRFRDMYAGGFYRYSTKEEFWAYWARYIYINRYLDAPKPVYEQLLELVKGKDYFVITTNVDHCFQKAGFDKKRLFYTQGDYGLFQSVTPNVTDGSELPGRKGFLKTYDNEEWVMEAMKAQGFVKNAEGIFEIPLGVRPRMSIPTGLLPKCPDDGSDMTTNLRSDDTFVEDQGWHRASAAYSDFIRRHAAGDVLYLELGVGSNTPVIIKYPFWQMTRDNENAVYACLNYGEACCPAEIAERSICIDGDIGEILEALKEN